MKTLVPCGRPAAAQGAAPSPTRSAMKMLAFDAGAPRSGAGAHHSTQSAMKMLVSPSCWALRFEAKISFEPSGENIGKPSKTSV